MGPREAIARGLVRSFQYSGRATRSEFWWFASVALLPLIYTANRVPWDQFDFSGIWRVGLLMLVATPLLVAGYRRIQDAGEEGHQILLPFMPVMILWVTYQAFYRFALATAFTGVGLLVGFLAILVLVPACFFALLTSLFTIGPVIGLLILPSQRGPSFFGPNPNEVTP